MTARLFGGWDDRSVRFDDTLETVLAADVSTAFGKASAWRQLVDLIGRRRIPGDARAIALLESIRGDVPAAARITSARSLENAEPPASLVRLCAVDDIAVAAPILRSARLNAGEWIELLPQLTPAARGVLRNRRDLPQPVMRALEGFRAADFVIADSAGSVAGTVEAPSGPRAAASGPADGTSSDFIPIGVAAMGIPLVAAALQQTGDAPPETAMEAEPAAATPVAAAPAESQTDEMPGGDARPDTADPFEIAAVVARIDAFYTRQQDPPRAPAMAVGTDGFRFETDAQGVIRWVEGISRAPLIGLSLDMAATHDGSRVDGAAGGAFRQRAGFAGARLFVAGESEAGGDWRISATPAFDPATGRFAGYRGAARRPRRDDTAHAATGSRGADSLRQLMHELRTPTNAIAGFAELIEREILGEAEAVYRERAAVIRDHARSLLAAIDDLDIAARIDASALRLHPGEIALRPLLVRIGEDLGALAAVRGARLALPDANPVVAGDARAVERLLARTLATLLSAAEAGEIIAMRLMESGDSVAIAFDRPRAFAGHTGETIFAIEDETESAALLGTGFAFRLIRNLARELSGSLALDAESLTIRLPSPVTKSLEQVR